MKKLISTFLISVSFHCSAQQIDSTQIKIQQLQKAITYMADNLQSAHTEYKVGIFVSLGGIILNATGISVQGSTKNALLISGSALSLIGSIVIIDSHKFFGRAGKWHFSENSLVYDF